MNNIFDIKRFGNFALMNYWYHKRQYLCLMAGAVVLLLMILCRLRFASTSLSWASSALPIDRVTEIFTSGFYITGALFTVWFIRISMQGITGQSLTMHDMLIPVSTFERYIFAIVNSTLVASVVYIILFQLVSEFAESLYLFSDNGYLFKGFVGYNEAHIVNKEFIHECHISLWDIISNGVPSSEPTFFVIIYTFFISVFMWGEITFQNRGAAILTVLTHLAIVVVVSIFMTNLCSKNLYPTGMLHVSYDMVEFKKHHFFYLIFYIFPIVYQWVVWKKLKTISLTK